MLTLLFQRFFRYLSHRIIVTSVIAIHFLCVIAATVAALSLPAKKPHKPLIVKTITPKVTSTQKKPQGGAVLQAPKIAAAPKPQPIAPQKKIEPVKPQAQPPKKIAQKTTASPAKVEPKVKKDPAIVDKKLSPSKKPLTAPAPRAKISDSLLKELEESIAKIESKGDKKTSIARQPPINKAFGPISLQIDIAKIGAEDEQSNYIDILVQHLHQALRLPDFGEVKIQLSLRQDGTVAKLSVLKAQSEKNKRYLETNLPVLKFPRLDGDDASKKEQTFTLTFCNEL